MLGRNSHRFLLLLAINVFLLAMMFVHASVRQREDAAVLERMRQLVRHHGLTDLCLFTDARYTRNPSMADFNTPFQDYPLSLEHFPSGSLLGIPPHLRSRGRTVANGGLRSQP